MSDSSGVPETQIKGILEPDPFWEIIEKLLLNTSRDEQMRIRHNLSLSALCRGHAVSRIPRDKNPQRSDRINDRNNSKNNGNQKELKVPKKNESKSIDKTVKVPKRNVRLIRSQNSTAHQTRSECCISDSKVIFVKNPEIPECERLWRFALQNRQQKQDDKINEIGLKSIPSARSNEAIFEGLKKRLEDARKQEYEVSTKTTTTKAKPNRKTTEVKKHHCERQSNNAQKSTYLKRNKNRSNTYIDASVSPEKHSKPPLIRQYVSTPNFAHDFSHKPVQNLVEASERDCTKPISEHFESTKSQYDCVLKKRLRCGNQLDRLNREITSKKINSRLVLCRDTTKKYLQLKTDYLKLCYQESSLRHQIAMLQAEIHMMQNKVFYKRPAAVKTITFDSKSAHVPHKFTTQSGENDTNKENKVLLFPRLKPPKSLVVPQQKASLEHYYDRGVHNKKPGVQRQVSTISQKLEPSDECTTISLPCINNSTQAKGICSIYSLTTSLDPPPKRQPSVLKLPEPSDVYHMETTHRLPKLSLDCNSSYFQQVHSAGGTTLMMEPVSSQRPSNTYYWC